MDWGIALGSAAESAVDTFQGLQKNSRDNAANARAENVDKRAQAEADRAAAAQAESDDYYKNISGGETVKVNGGLKLPPPAKPASEQPSSAPATRSNLGAGSIATPASDEAVEQAQAKAAGATPSAPPKTPPAQASNIPATGLRVGGVDAAEAAYARHPSKTAYEELLKSRAVAEVSAEREEKIRMSKVQRRAAEQEIDVATWKHAIDKSSRAAGEANAVLNAWDSQPGETPLASDKATANDFFNGLRKSYDMSPNGIAMSYKEKDGEYVVSLKDVKSGTVTEHSYKSVADARQLGQIAGVMANPEAHAQYVVHDQATKLAAAIGGTERALKVGDTKNALDAQKALTDSVQMLSDPDTAYEKKAEIEMLAHKAAVYSPKEILWNERVKVKNPDTGETEEKTIEHNRILDMQRLVTPEENVKILDVDGVQRDMHIEEAIQNAITKMPSILKSAAYNTGAVAHFIQEDLLSGGFNPIVVKHATAKIFAGYQRAEAKKAKPSSLQFPDSVRGPRGIGR